MKNLDYETGKHIEGLINNNDFRLFKNSLENIVNDLELEGFELSDVRLFLLRELNELLGDQ
jgi:hypothetical protein